MSNANFWEHKSLAEMTRQEWESLCDGCGKCCLHKLIDDETPPSDFVSSDAAAADEQVHFTDIACSLLHTDTCSCTHYAQRNRLVPDCVQLTEKNLAITNIFYLPPSCTYRRLQEGRGMPSWHPLLNRGSKRDMHRVGMSVRGKTICERDVSPEAFEQHIVTWPLADLD